MKNTKKHSLTQKTNSSQKAISCRINMNPPSNWQLNYLDTVLIHRMLRADFTIMYLLVQLVFCAHVYWSLETIERKIHELHFYSLSEAKAPDSRSKVLWLLQIMHSAVQSTHGEANLHFKLCPSWQTILDQTEEKSHICLVIACRSVSNRSSKRNVFRIHGARSAWWINFFLCGFQLFFLALWEDKRLRGTASVIVICIAIKTCKGKSFQRAHVSIQTIMIKHKHLLLYPNLHVWIDEVGKTTKAKCTFVFIP